VSVTAKLLKRAHRPDEDLVAWLDGELPALKAWLIRCHLDGCWKCRTRASELETEVHRITTLIEGDRFPSPERVDAARARLMGRIWRLSSHPEVPGPRNRKRLWWLAAAAGAAAIWLFVPLRHSPAPPPQPQPQALLAEVTQAERAAVHQLSARGSVHQTFRVSAVQTSPVHARRESRLDVWSDPSLGRFTARWQDASGKLRRALWRPERTRSYSYSSDGPRTVRVVHTTQSDHPIPDLVGDDLSLDALERAFLRWLETRPWTTVALADGLRRFIAADGATLAAATGHDGLRLRATRNIAGGRIVFELLAENQSRRPRLQRVAWERYGQVFELQIVAEKEAEAVRASFEPDRSLFSRPAPEMPPAPPLVAAPPKQDLLSLQIQAMYVLHKLSVCLGEGVELAREEDAVVVRGVVGTRERKEQIAAALSALSEAHPLRVEIESANEAVARLGSQPAEQPARTLVAARHALDPAGPSPHPWCKGKTVKACSQAKAKVLQVAEALVAEAAELRNLDTLRRTVSSDTAVRADSRRLLDLMAQAHADGLRTGTARLWQSLGQLAPEPAWAPAPLSSTATGQDPAHLYASARDLSRELHEALAGTGGGDASAQARHTVASASVFQAVLEAVAGAIGSRQAKYSNSELR